MMAWPGCVCLMCVGALFVAVLLLLTFCKVMFLFQPRKMVYLEIKINAKM